MFATFGIYSLGLALVTMVSWGALAVSSGAVILGVYALGRVRTSAPALFPAEMVAASQAQADAMRLMAERTAEGLRAANGTYVFALRDRFDEALPPAQLGVAETGWVAVGDAPGAVEELVFHAGDAIRFTARLVCNQAVGRRTVSLRWIEADGVTTVAPTIGTASGRDISTTKGELPTDTTAFIEFPIDLTLTEFDIASPSSLDRTATAELTITDNRAEGAVVTHRLAFRVRGYLQPDDDGVAIETPAVEVTIGEEQRRWFLDKASMLLLALPGHQPT